MARYDYRCRTCEVSFEVQRSVHDAPEVVACPTGHLETTRVFSAVAVGGAAAAPASERTGGGGCCGGSCCG